MESKSSFFFLIFFAHYFIWSRTFTCIHLFLLSLSSILLLFTHLCLLTNFMFLFFFTYHYDCRLRLATPLEEVNRSWNKRPRALDMNFNRELVKKFQDPDGDDESYRTYVLEKKAQRRNLIADRKAEE